METVVFRCFPQSESERFLTKRPRLSVLFSTRFEPLLRREIRDELVRFQQNLLGLLERLVPLRRELLFRLRGKRMEMFQGTEGSQ